MVSDMEAAARLILSGRFLGYLSEHYADRFVAQGTLKAIRPDLFGCEAPFQLVFNRERASDRCWH